MGTPLRMKASKVLFRVTVFLLPAAGLCQTPTAADILRKVGATYQGLRQYRLVARVQDVRTKLESSTRQESHQDMRIDLSVAQPANVYLYIKDNNRQGDVLVRSEQTYVISNGRKAWVYLPKQNEYTEDPSESAFEARKLAIYANNLLVTQYLSMWRLSGHAALERDKKLDLNGHKVECFTVKISQPGEEQELWIDKQSFLVLESTEKVKAQFNSHGQTDWDNWVIRLESASVNTPLQSAQFEFTPPANAHGVQP